MGTVAEQGRVDLTGRTIHSQLIGGLSATHREWIAFSLDLPRKSSSRQIAAAFKRERRLREILGELSIRAHQLLTEATFNASGIVLKLDRFDLDHAFRRQDGRVVAVRELERCGLVFAFRTSNKVFYRIPEDLQLQVRSVLVARYARTVRSATAQKWLMAPRQDLHDIASIWLEIARAPVPLSLDGEIRANSKPRLLAALPVLDLPDSDGALTRYRLELALTQLRDSGLLRLEEIERGEFTATAKLVASGHIADALRDDATFEHPPEEEYYRDRDIALCALALGEALEKRRVGIASFATGFDALLSGSGNSMYSESTPAALTLSTLLPFWLRGEVRFGVSARGKPVAISFEHCPEADRSLARRLLSEFYDQFRLPGTSEAEGTEALSPEDESDIATDLYRYPSRSRSRWSPREPTPRLMYELQRIVEWDSSGITQISTLDAPLDENLLFSR